MRRTAILLSVAILAGCASTDPQVTQGTSVEPAPTTSDTEGQTPDTQPPGGEPDDPVPDDPTPDDPTTDDAPSDGPTDRATIEWGPCANEDYSPDVECGTVTVPLDYDTADGPTIEISVTRLPATDRTEGSILLNPGGPGGSGNEYLAEQLAVDPTSFGTLTRRFDLVGFDPRGVGESSPVDCVDDAFLDTHLFDDPTPDTPEEVAALEAAGTELRAGCAAWSDRLAEYDTLNTARDMDLIRAAVGDELMTYYGASYGTYLGGAYATLFPERVRAMVLDGAYYPAGVDEFEDTRIQLMGFEDAFANWVADCQADTSCPFHADDVSARWIALRSQLDASPAPSRSGRAANEAAVVDGTKTAMYSPSLWGPLALALAAAERGDGTPLVTLAELGAGREPDGTWANLAEAYWVIICSSGLLGAASTDLDAKVAALREAAPHFGYGITAADFGRACDGLAVGPETTFSYDGTGPILVTGGENDPATPFLWAERLATALGERATVLTYTGEGHTALGSSACVTAATETVLGAAEPAAPGLVCAADPPAEAPEWFTDLPQVAGLEPFPLDDAAATFGFPDGTYVEPFTSTVAEEDLVASLERALTEAGWDAVGTESVPFGEESATMLIFSSEVGMLQVFVLGPAIVASPDLGAIGGLIPDGAALVLYISF